MQGKEKTVINLANIITIIMTKENKNGVTEKFIDIIVTPIEFNIYDYLNIPKQKPLPSSQLTQI